MARLHRRVTRRSTWWLGAAIAAVLAIAPAALGGRHAAGVRRAGAPLSVDRRLGPLVRSPRGPFRDGHVLVGFRPGTSVASERRIERRAGAIRSRRVGTAVLLVVRRGTVPATIRRLRADPRIRYAEPDYVLEASGVPDDPAFGVQWALRNTGQSVNGVAGAAGADEDAVAAWQVTTGSRSIVVAVADTGVDYTHPDLAANMWANPGGVGGCAAGTNGFDVLAGEDPCDPMDTDTAYGGHGTHVAGIIGAEGDNGAGVAGVNWRTSILAVKWMDSADMGLTSDLLSALQQIDAARQAGVNIRVVNDSATFAGTAFSQALSDEIDALGSDGILFVTAAGNSAESDDQTPRYPCSYDRPTEICVTATTQSDQLPSWANWGSGSVDLAAPGDNIYSTLRGGGYGYISGGSMAAAEVSGAAALILSSGNRSVSGLKADILNNVDVLPSLSGLVGTGGRLDVCRAIAGCTAVSPVADVDPPVVAGTAQEGQTLTASPGNWSGTSPAFAYRWSRCDAGGSGCVPIGGATSASYAVAGGDVGDRLKVTVTASNARGSSSATSTPTAIVLPLGPLSIALPAISGSAVVGQALIAGGGSWTEAPTAFAYQWLRCDGAGSGCSAVGGATSPSYVVGDADVGDRLEVTVTATNAGGSASATSDPTAVVGAPAVAALLGPVSSAPPAISGSAVVGRTLTAGSGSWTGSPTAFAYRWLRCDGAGRGCAGIAGATSASYQVAAGDVGHRLEVTVKASNAAGSASATSAPTAAVAAVLTLLPSRPSVTALVHGAQRSATFDFRSARARGFRCALVLAPAHAGARPPKPRYRPCGARTTYRHLKRHRAYVLYVRAVNAAGWERVAAVYRFRIA